MLERSLPSECHACGYDMHGRLTGEPCPECGAAFDTRPIAPGSSTRSMTILVCLWLAIAAMPFVALLSVILLIVAYANDRGLDKSLAGRRLSYRVHRRLRLARWLGWIFLAEFGGFMLISEVWPDALNWW